MATVLALLPIILHMQRIGSVGFFRSSTQAEQIHSCAAPTCSACAALRFRYAGGAGPTDFLFGYQGRPLPKLAMTQHTRKAGSRCDDMQIRLQCISANATEHSVFSHQVDLAVDPRKHLPLHIAPVLQSESCLI